MRDADPAETLSLIINCFHGSRPGLMDGGSWCFITCLTARTNVYWTTVLSCKVSLSCLRSRLSEIRARLVHQLHQCTLIVEYYHRSLADRYKIDPLVLILSTASTIYTNASKLQNLPTVFLASSCFPFSLSSSPTTSASSL